MIDKRFALHIPAFIIALSVGLLYVYLATPHRKVVVRQPTVENAGKVIYEDKDGNCFILKPQTASCNTATPMSVHNIVSSIIGVQG